MLHCCYFKTLSLFFLTLLHLFTGHWTPCHCVHEAVRGHLAGISSSHRNQCRTQGSNSVLSGLAAGAFTPWANSPAPKHIFFNWRVGTQSEFYFDITPKLVLNLPSSSLSLPITGITGLHHHPWLKLLFCAFRIWPQATVLHMRCG